MVFISMYFFSTKVHFGRNTYNLRHGLDKHYPDSTKRNKFAGSIITRQLLKIFNSLEHERAIYRRREERLQLISATSSLQLDLAIQLANDAGFLLTRDLQCWNDIRSWLEGRMETDCQKLLLSHPRGIYQLLGWFRPWYTQYGASLWTPGWGLSYQTPLNSGFLFWSTRYCWIGN